MDTEDFKYFFKLINVKSPKDLRQKVKILFENFEITQENVFDYVLHIKAERSEEASEYLQTIESTIQAVSKANCRIRNDNLNTAVNNVVRDKSIENFQNSMKK